MAYRRLWAASVVCAVGGSFSVVAVPAQLFAVAGTSAAVGAAGAVSFGALVVAALWIGALADVADRRTVLLGAQVGLALTYAALWAHAALGGRSVPLLLALVACQGLSLGAIMTTMGAVVPRLVPAEFLAAASSLTSLTRYAGSILGPVLAGVLVPVTGVATLYLLDAVALLSVVWAVLRLPPLPPNPDPAGPTDPAEPAAPAPPATPADPAPPADPAAPTGSAGNGAGSAGNGAGSAGNGAGSAGNGAGSAGHGVGSAGHGAGGRRAAGGLVLAGLRYLAGSRLLVAVLAVDLAAMVLGMPTALFPELAQHTFGGRAGGGPELGLLYAAYPAGVLAAGLLSGTFTRARRHGALMAAAAAAWALTVVALGAAPWLWLALAALVAGGAVNFVLSTFRNAITQAHARDAVRGRIQGSLTVVLFGGPQLANLLHGAAASALGPRTAIVAGGLLTALTVAVVVRAAPELRRYTVATPDDH
ncbi:MFS transporter [Nonomuraea bangladeshensis]|uniref:MFS transporter n=1 Tax=Nonomuraea bangladeshensis TaxID=404385 RepID=UPI0031CE7716